MWVVRVSDGRRLEFTNFGDARTYLLSGFWWGAEDYHGSREPFMQAWAEAATWDINVAHQGQTYFEITVLGLRHELMRLGEEEIRYGGHDQEIRD